MFAYHNITFREEEGGSNWERALVPIFLVSYLFKNLLFYFIERVKLIL